MLKRVKYQGVSLPIPLLEEIKKHIKDNPRIHGVPEFVRIAIREKILDLNLLKEFTSKSELTEEDALELGRKVNKALSKRYRRNA